MKIKFKQIKSDILLFDETNKDIVINTILHGFNYSILETRHKVAVINYHICFQLLAKLPRVFRKKKTINKLRELKKIYFLAVIDYIAPKIIITYMDNVPYFHEICRERQDIVGIAIQNGARTHYNFDEKCQFEHINRYYLPYYFVHGDHVEEVYKRYNHQSKEIFTVGSLKLDYFLNSPRKVKHKKYQLSLISTWTNGNYVVGNYPWSAENQYRSLLLVKDMIVKSGLSCVVALKTNQDNELNYYKSIFQDMADYKIDVEDRFSSYNICCNSEVILSTYSTLGFELFSLGKNVVFFNLSSDERYTHSDLNTINDLNSKSLLNLIYQMMKEPIEYKYNSVSENQCIQSKKPSYEKIREFIKERL
tara:strand:- start:2217 stop:3305 length:1089 start_codon:yes stop_codon:yes gene_type:complete